MDDDGGGIDLGASLVEIQPELYRLVIAVQDRAQVCPVWFCPVKGRREGGAKARQLLGW
jgi:hypothetical protein